MAKKSQPYKNVKSSKNRSDAKKANTSANSGGSPQGEKTKICSVKPNNDQNSSAMKKIWSFTDLVEAMKPTAQELKFRERKIKEHHVLSANSNTFKCTKCNWNFNIGAENCEKVQVHPCLGVLMCKVCCDYYNDGEFSADSDGEDKYCRWCGEGGTLFGCSKCICGFCKTCIKKHFGNEYLKQVEEDDDWLCFFCNPKPLWHERYICSLAIKMSQNKTSGAPSETTNGKKGSKNHSSSKSTTRSPKRKKEPKTSHNQHSYGSSSSKVPLEKWSDYGLQCKDGKGSKKRLYSSSSDESEISFPERQSKKMKLPSVSQQLQGSGEEENFESLKQMVLEKLERVVKLSEYQMAFGMKWTCKVLNRLADPSHIKTPEDLQRECIKFKGFLSALAAHLLEFCSSIDSAEKNIPIQDGLKDSNNLLQSPTDPTGFAGIIKFLSFITNQVNAFVKRGFSLSEVLEAEILHENNFIGLKRTSKTFGSGTSRESACSVFSGTTETSFNENNGDSEPNPKTMEKLDEIASSDDETTRSRSEKDSKTQEESQNESDDFSSCSPEMKDTKNDIRQIMQILENS